MLLPGILSSALIALSLAQPEDLEDVATTGALNLALEHSLDGGATFSPRGSISVETSRTGSVSLNSDDQREVDAGTVAQLGKLCASSGLYLLKVRAQRQGGEPVTHRTVADPCMLVENRLSDVIVLHVDWKLQMVGVSVVAPKRSDAASRAKRSSAAPAAAPTRFTSTVTIQAMEVGPTPDTAAFIQKMEQEKLQKQRGETKDNRSFFAKYWMYIIPVVLFLAMSSGNPDGGGGR